MLIVLTVQCFNRLTLQPAGSPESPADVEKSTEPPLRDADSHVPPVARANMDTIHNPQGPLPGVPDKSVHTCSTHSSVCVAVVAQHL